MDTPEEESVLSLFAEGLICIPGEDCCTDDPDYDTVIITSVN